MQDVGCPAGYVRGGLRHCRSQAIVAADRTATASRLSFAARPSTTMAAALTAPNGTAQQAVIRARPRGQRADPAQVGYVERTVPVRRWAIRSGALAGGSSLDRAKDRPMRSAQ